MRIIVYLITVIPLLKIKLLKIDMVSLLNCGGLYIEGEGKMSRVL